MIFLYNLFLFFSLFLSSPYLLAKLITTRRYRIGLRERLGHLPLEIVKSFRGERPIWVHAVSAGELMATRPFLEGLLKNYSFPILLSTTTEAGYRIAKKSFSQIPTVFFPFDFPLITKNFIYAVRPKIFIAIESEIWPNLLNILKKKKIPAVLVNGRLSERSYSNYRRLGLFSRRLFSQLTCLGMRTSTESERIIHLGAKRERVFVTGNLKYDAAFSLQERIEPEQISKTLKILQQAQDVNKDSPLIVFGSLHPEEEEGIIQHCAQLRNLALLIFAPRHPERSRLKTFLKRKDLKYILWSKIHPHPVSSPLEGEDRGEGKGLNKEKIIILDTMGELPLFYSVATLVFVGGSLIPWGGHNILEPAAFKKPVLFGPYMGNFLEEAALLKASGGAIEVKDAEGLFSAFSELLAHPEKTKSMGEACFQVVKQHLGATEKNIELIKDLI